MQECRLTYDMGILIFHILCILKSEFLFSFSHQALLQAHDEVLKNASVEDANTYPNDNDTSFNDRPAEDSVGERTEKLTRVRLVQFHKQLNEPMVSMSVSLIHPLRTCLL